MNKIFISGLINTETTIVIPKFPIPYQPVHYNFHGVKTTVSGVGWNVAKALATLGDDICFAGLVGEDVAARSIRAEFEKYNVSQSGLMATLKDTPQSAILYDQKGRRSIHTDLKDIQDSTYPIEKARELMKGCNAAVLCNVNFSRPLLELTHELGKKIITDVHAISSLDDEYNGDFIRKSDVLFFSHENIGLENLKDFIQSIAEKTEKKVIVAGMGKDGAMVWDADSKTIQQVSGIPQKRVKNSVGAGDSLLSSFAHFYVKGQRVMEPLELAQKFAAHKIQFSGGAEGFLSEEELLRL